MTFKDYYIIGLILGAGLIGWLFYMTWASIVCAKIQADAEKNQKITHIEIEKPFWNTGEDNNEGTSKRN